MDVEATENYTRNVPADTHYLAVALFIALLLMVFVSFGLALLVIATAYFFEICYPEDQVLINDGAKV